MKHILGAVIFLTLPFLAGLAGAGQGGSAISSLGLSGADVAVPRTEAPAAEPGAVAQEDLSLWNEYIEKNFGASPSKTVYLPAQNGNKNAAGEVLETVDLAGILNAGYKTGLTFRSSANTIHVSGAEALNCQSGDNCSSNDKYFLLFTSDKGQTAFVRAKDVANALFMSGSKEISFDGDSEKYTIKLNVKLTSPGKSRLNIIGPGGDALNISLDDLTAALLAKGHALKSGARHNLYYNTAVLQDSKGNGRFGNEKVLVFSPRGSDSNQTVRASKIGAAGVLLPEVEKNLGFRIISEKLEIYSL